MVKQLPQSYKDMLYEIGNIRSWVGEGVDNTIKYVPQLVRILTEDGYSIENAQRIAVWDTVSLRKWWEYRNVKEWFKVGFQEYNYRWGSFNVFRSILSTILTRSSCG